jgi:hypothetical protein
MPHETHNIRVRPISATSGLHWRKNNSVMADFKCTKIITLKISDFNRRHPRSHWKQNQFTKWKVPTLKPVNTNADKKVFLAHYTRQISAQKWKQTT